MPWRPAPSDRFYRVIVRTGQLFRAALGLQVICTGEENLPAPDPRRGASRAVQPGTGAVFALTHFGYLDFAVVELMLWRHTRAQLRFLIHQGAADHWLAGPAISASGHVVVGYDDRKDAYDAAVAKLRAGEYLAVFPEAGVSRSYTVRECKTGAVRMAAEAGVPVIPISIWGAHRLLTRGHGFSLRRAWRAPIRVHIGEPLRFGADDAADLATESLRETLQHGIDLATADFPLPAEPGAWWLPARLGGAAPSERERQSLDAADAARGRRRRSPRPTG
ncbi:2-acyl-glycerophospho-ethanolamine acyltransferase [Arthrobacter ulcerisalmonis]|uniref:2-acyl-glycerophospho-ethanolamine acyltransferase n=1 Tax=Arthrobacter ulcerisalmonis TaxID=2483813 RepID=A0A3P5XGW6_9MICC|nr:lysophospholipid acyltransferase family protein [Arthrobacter ulcerisalmonis]VDC30153.1 2-acyl-glycerophospho-ethanolamine acyltransferase [Arthrobacter ulcerisalmonis]